MEKTYNLYSKMADRWTNMGLACEKNSTVLRKLTLDQATYCLSELNKWSCYDDWEIKLYPEDQSSDSNDSKNISILAINDYTCPVCHNDRCSKSEKICWKCGNKF